MQPDRVMIISLGLSKIAPFASVKSKRESQIRETTGTRTPDSINFWNFETSFGKYLQPISIVLCKRRQLQLYSIEPQRVHHDRERR